MRHTRALIMEKKTNIGEASTSCVKLEFWRSNGFRKLPKKINEEEKPSALEQWRRKVIKKKSLVKWEWKIWWNSMIRPRISMPYAKHLYFSTYLHTNRATTLSSIQRNSPFSLHLCQKPKINDFLLLLLFLCVWVWVHAQWQPVYLLEFIFIN